MEVEGSYQCTGYYNQEPLNSTTYNVTIAHAIEGTNKTARTPLTLLIFSCIVGMRKRGQLMVNMPNLIELCVGLSAQSMDPSFAQRNLWNVQIHALSLTYRERELGANTAVD